MLFDPAWKEAKTGDKFSLDTLIAWLERQPVDGTYNYINSNQCLLAKYYTEMYGEPICVSSYGNHGYASGSARDFPSPDSFWKVAAHINAGFHKDWTFGGALRRAKAYQNA